MNTVPAKLPARRSIHWFVEAWRAAFQKPLLWLPATLALAAVQVLLLAACLYVLAAVMMGSSNTSFPGVFGAVIAMMLCLLLLPVLSLGALPLFVAPFSEAARKHFLHGFPGTSAPRRFWLALLFSALLATLLALVLLVPLWGWGTFLNTRRIPTDADEIFLAAYVFCSSACALWCAFLILLTQTLAACGASLRVALARAAHAAVRPAFLCHIATLTCVVAALLSMYFATMRHGVHFKILDYGALFALMLEMLITPWLMARDMFGTEAE